MSRTQRAFIVSILLHLALLLGLAGIRYDIVDSAPSFRVLLIELDARSSPEQTAPHASAESIEPARNPGSERPESPRAENDQPGEAPDARSEPRTLEAAISAAASDSLPTQATATQSDDAREPAPEALNAESLRAAAAANQALEPVLSTHIPSRRVPPPATVMLKGAEMAVLKARADAWLRDAEELAANTEQLTFTADGQTYQASFALHPASDSMAIDQIIVDVETDKDGQRFGTELRLQRMAFSSFAQFVDRWDPRVQIHDDEISGRFHSNSEIFVQNSGGVQPIFHGKVTTARTINTSGSERRVARDQVFLGGVETRVGRIALPKRLEALTANHDADASNRQHFQRDARVTFAADGSYSWRYLSEMPAPQRVQLPSEPYYLIADDKVELHVKGQVNGKVLIYSPEAIIIEGDLTYATDPELDPETDDFLGLASDKRVEIAAPDTTGPGDLRLQASIYAKRRFTVRNYRSRKLGTLYLYGSLTAGTLSATEPRYRTKLVFDPRLKTMRPPSFPMSDRFETLTWDEQWTALPANDPG